MDLAGRANRTGEASLPESPPRRLYIHVPFCARRCGYCNFSLVAGRDYLIDRYLECLQLEIERELAVWDVNSVEIDSCFLGGGTPTHLPAKHFQRLLDLVLTYARFNAEGEFTVEANPNDIDRTHVQIMSDFGVNRISLGAQSFDSEKLKFLEREHNAEDIFNAVELVQSFSPCISLDLIFGIVGESLQTWQRDLSKAVSLPIHHLSTYALTIEKGTAFGNRQSKNEALDVGNDVSADLYELAIDRLCQEGWEHYEISSFAKKGRRCRHNLGYWNQVPDFAFGPGAASFNGVVRKRNHQSVTTYLKRIENNESPVDYLETLDAKAIALDRLIFGLRQLDGIVLDDFRQHTGMDVEDLVANARLQRLVDGGWLKNDQGRLRLTRSGIMVSDSIWSQFLEL